MRLRRGEVWVRRVIVWDWGMGPWLARPVALMGSIRDSSVPGSVLYDPSWTRLPGREDRRSRRCRDQTVIGKVKAT